MVAHLQREKPCESENQILLDVDHSVQDTTATTQDLEQKQGIGVVGNGKDKRSTRNHRRRI
jgi:hypothetical protein